MKNPAWSRFFFIFGMAPAKNPLPVKAVRLLPGTGLVPSSSFDILGLLRSDGATV